MASIRSFINSRFVALAGTEKVGRICIDTVNVTEIQISGAGNDIGLPVLAGVSRSHKCSVASAGPGDLLVDCADTAQSSVCPTLLLLPALGGTLNRYRHFSHHCGFGKTAPAVAAAGAIHDSRAGRWQGLAK